MNAPVWFIFLLAVFLTMEGTMSAKELEMDMLICPVCNRNMIAKEAYAAITRFLVENGCTVNLCNPGGREFHFPKIGRVQIHDYCHWCDIEKLQKAKADAEAKQHVVPH